MNVLKLPVEHYAEEINAICARLNAIHGDLGRHSSRESIRYSTSGSTSTDR